MVDTILLFNTIKKPNYVCNYYYCSNKTRYKGDQTNQDLSTGPSFQGGPMRLGFKF